MNCYLRKNLVGAKRNFPSVDKIGSMKLNLKGTVDSRKIHVLSVSSFWPVNNPLSDFFKRFVCVYLTFFAYSEKKLKVFNRSFF